MSDTDGFLLKGSIIVGVCGEFCPRAELSDSEEWREVPEKGDADMRFFKVTVDLP